jgi:hypothetical protein
VIDGKYFHDSFCGAGWLRRVLKGHPALRFDWQSCIDPGGKSAQQCLDARVAIMQKEERRTGALVLILSGTVCDDPPGFLERETGHIPFDLAQRNGDRAGDVTFLKSTRTAHIHKDRRAAVERYLCCFEGDTRHFCFCERQLAFF